MSLGAWANYERPNWIIPMIWLQRVLNITHAIRKSYTISGTTLTHARMNAWLGKIVDYVECGFSYLIIGVRVVEKHVIGFFRILTTDMLRSSSSWWSISMAGVEFSCYWTVRPRIRGCLIKEWENYDRMNSPAWNLAFFTSLN